MSACGYNTLSAGNFFTTVRKPGLGPTTGSVDVTDEVREFSQRHVHLVSALQVRRVLQRRMHLLRREPPRLHHQPAIPEPRVVSTRVPQVGNVPQPVGKIVTVHFGWSGPIMGELAGHLDEAFPGALADEQEIGRGALNGW